MATKRKKPVKMAELRTDIPENDVKELEAGGYLAVLRWVKFGKPKLLRTHEALRKLRSAPPSSNATEKK